MSNIFSRRNFIAGAALAATAPRTVSARATGPYVGAARDFLDTMIEKGTDRYGSKSTPVFCLSLDPEKHMPPRAPEKIDWTYRRSFEYLYRDFGYYWKSHLHSADLIYDQGTIRALYALTDADKNPKYRRAADAYLDFFLSNMVSEQTGIFGWGEHIFYNVFLDYLIGGAFTVKASRNFSFNHELERWTTIYDLTWPKSPAKTLAEIDAIYEYKIHDPKTFINNRHSDYFEGRKTSDTLTFVKHSGLFVHAFTFAYAKTNEPQYRDWAMKAADLFWGYRDPRTNLVRSSVQRKDEPVAVAELALLVLFLLRSFQWHPEQVYLDRALAYLHGYQKYFKVDDQGHYRDVVGTDGVDHKPGQFSEYWEGPLRMAKAAVLAYSLSADPAMLELADDIASRITPEMKFDTIIQRSLISDEVESRAVAISTVIDLYEVTGNRKYLTKAQELADDAIRKFLYRGLFVSTMQLYPEGDKTVHTKVYDGRSAAGWLALNLIRLQNHSDATEAGHFKKVDKLERIYD
jgi:uncharacterized protein YyaL (SSP411 family)